LSYSANVMTKLNVFLHPLQAYSYWGIAPTLQFPWS
jgi:hypothetical protein